MAKAKSKYKNEREADRRKRQIKMLKAYQQDYTYLTAKRYPANITYAGKEPDVGNAAPMLSRDMALDALLSNAEKRAMIDELRDAIWHQYPRYASTMSKCPYRHCGLSSRGGRICATCATRRLVALMTRDINERQLYGKANNKNNKFRKDKLYGPWAVRSLHMAIKKARDMEACIERLANDMFPSNEVEDEPRTGSAEIGHPNVNTD